jgi:hypothetical protein
VQLHLAKGCRLTVPWDDKTAALAKVMLWNFRPSKYKVSSAWISRNGRTWRSGNTFTYPHKLLQRYQPFRKAEPFEMSTASTVCLAIQLIIFSISFQETRTNSHSVPLCTGRCCALHKITNASYHRDIKDQNCWQSLVTASCGACWLWLLFCQSQFCVRLL